MAEPLASSEENSRRIARIESCFGAAGRPLMAPGRVLVGEGTLTKLCRKGPKPRQFFLFDDMVVYGAAVLGSRRYANQRVLALEAVAICTLPDEGELRNGWLMQTPAKSFKVFAATESERAEWISHIERCVRELRAKRGLPPLPAPCNSPGPGGAGASSSTTAAVIAAASPADGSEPAAWWVPDSSASACMRCQRSRFNALNRRHHCRKCGIVVCGACSDRRFLLPSQSSRPLRVCIGCFDSLTAAAVTAPAGPRSSSSAADDLVDRVAKVTVTNGNRGSSGAAEEGRPAVSRGRRGDGARTSNGTQDSSDDDDDDDDGGDGGRGGGSGEDWADRSPIGNRTGFYS